MYPLANQIILGKELSVLAEMPNGSIDVTITSPPYNLGVSSGGGIKSGANSGKWKSAALINNYDEYDDQMSRSQYIEWQRTVLSELWRVTSDKGAIYYNHKPRVQNKVLQTPLELLPEDVILRQIIIWARNGGINFSPTHYLPTHEWILLLAKPEFKLKSQGASGTGDVWNIAQERDNPHPAPFPLELPLRILESLGEEIKFIFDPYMGSGTTAVAAKMTGREYFGCDVSQSYIDQANERLSAVQLSLPTT